MAVVFHNVIKNFSNKRVLHGLNFEVRRGEFAVLLGPNGAGKSTSISLATGLLMADEGKVEIFGHAAGHLSARQKCAYVPQEPAFPGHVRATDLLKFAAAHGPGEDLSELTQDFGMSGFLSTQVRHLSGGQRRTLSLACAFAMRPELVILDEPTTGLDLEMRRRVWRYLRRYHENGGTLLMTTHYLAEAEELAERIIVLSEGKVTQTGSPDEIKRRYGFKRISFACAQEPPGQLKAVRGEHGRWQVESREPDRALQEIIAWQGACDIDVVPLALEDVFLKLVGREDA